MSINLSIYPCALYHRKIWRCIFLPLFDTYAKMGNDTGFVQHSSHGYFLSSIFDARIYRVLYRRRLFEMHPEGSSFVDMISFIFSIDSILSYERVRIDLCENVFGFLFQRYVFRQNPGKTYRYYGNYRLQIKFVRSKLQSTDSMNHMDLIIKGFLNLVTYKFLCPKNLEIPKFHSLEIFMCTTNTLMKVCIMIELEK